MLELKGITKTYPAGGENVQALKGVDINFRESEFVSILGPSGCGKTTLLNIIGGLDDYTSGDLSINGKSTKKYKARDWDAYRNHSVGFVFQSYNLIPHQSVLQNVELALTLGGVSKRERRKRAKEALEKVGLGDQLKKKPNQMSGGQMQRVAIARAIVNNPSIILADEPTGALDTTTGIQIMEVLKELSKETLVIMVTHNPDLANTYSTRIINILDGLITGDSNPLSDIELATLRMKDIEALKTKKKKKKLPSMKFHTSFGLSLKNLFTKKGRTVLTSFAGSIGIIGIALIYAVSQGTTNYIDMVQEQTLTSYPITIEAKTLSISSLLSTFMGKAESIGEHENDAIYQKAMLYEMLNAMNSLDEKENDLESFRNYIERCKRNVNDPLHNALSAVQYTYNTNMAIYTKNVDGEIIISDTQALMSDLMKEAFGFDMDTMMSYSNQMVGGSTRELMQASTSLWKELLTGKDGSIISPLVKNQNDIIYGRWPEKYNEVVLFVDDKNELDDMTLYALGLKSKEEINELMDAVTSKKQLNYTEKSWSYKDICSMRFRTVLPCDCFTYDDVTGTYVDLRNTEAGLKYLFDQGLDIKVVGIAKAAEGSVSSDMNRYIGYTSELTKYIIDRTSKSNIVAAQKENPNTDIFTGLPFQDKKGNISASYKAEEFKKYVEQLNETEKAETYKAIMSLPNMELMNATVEQALSAYTRDQMEASLIQAMSQQLSMDAETIGAYIKKMSDDEIKDYFRTGIEEQFKASYAQQVAAKLSKIPAKQMAMMLVQSLATYTEEDCARYYDEFMEFSEASYEDNLKALGVSNIHIPTSINLYAASFSDKDVIEDSIAKYNKTVNSLKEIEYTDYVGLIMSSVTTIINAITYVLIAFVAVSLIVSSIMIGVITLISVQERTKEIGILRAIGASKKNVSSLFNAETVIIGFTSGALGIGITYLLLIPINNILHSVTGLPNLSAVLPIEIGVALIIISTFLTLIAGIIPSKSAARKDPVVALRTE